MTCQLNQDARQSKLLGASTRVRLSALAFRAGGLAARAAIIFGVLAWVTQSDTDNSLALISARFGVVSASLASGAMFLALVLQVLRPATAGADLSLPISVPALLSILVLQSDPVARILVAGLIALIVGTATVRYWRLQRKQVATDDGEPDVGNPVSESDRSCGIPSCATWGHFGPCTPTNDQETR